MTTFLSVNRNIAIRDWAQHSLSHLFSGCIKYGDTFEVYIDQTLACPNSAAFSGITQENCQKECLLADCMTFRYLLSAMECRTSNCTPLTNPDSLSAYSGVDLYMRNCAWTWKAWKWELYARKMFLSFIAVNLPTNQSNPFSTKIVLGCNRVIPAFGKCILLPISVIHSPNI